VANIQFAKNISVIADDRNPVRSRFYHSYCCFINVLYLLEFLRFSGISPRLNRSFFCNKPKEKKMFEINGGRVLRRGLLKKLKALINIVFVFCTQ